MNMMTYKDYVARIEYDEVDRIFVGHLAGIEDIVGFHGITVDELEKAFHESVDSYIAISEETGRPVQKSCNGNLTLHISPDIHANVITIAEVQGKSVNQWATEVFKKAVSS